MSTKKNYIGLAITPHDPALCILNHEGEVVFAEAAERYLQNKRAWQSQADDLFFSKELIETYCDPAYPLVLSLSWEKKFLKKMRNVTEDWRFGWLFKAYSKMVNNPLAYYRAKLVATGFNEYAGINIEYQYRSITQKPVTYRYFNHHLTHAAAGCYSSSFEEAACAILDGQGQYVANNYYHYKNGQIRKMHHWSSMMASLGLLYWLICEACGFDPWRGEEWKVMGLAAYGKYNARYYALLRDFYKVDGLNLTVSRRYLQATSICLSMAQNKNISSQEYADFAFTGQLVFTEYVIELLNNLHKVCPSDNLVLGGGCALNSSTVGTIRRDTPFKNIYVFAAPADDGNAVGAALLSYYKDNPHRARKEIQLPYLGSSMSGLTLQRLKQFGHVKIKSDCSFEEMIQLAATLLSEGRIIGWVQGRAEFGPRALGNRSILADPRDARVKERLNSEVKFREEFRPFAPSILHEFGSLYFEDYQESPYMERTLVFKESVREKIPGVVHVDGSGRLQTVKREWNAKYYDLIKAFYEITGIPIVLNTSFNVMGKPIIHRVEDALTVFVTSGLDVLVIENHIIFK